MKLHTSPAGRLALAAAALTGAAALSPVTALAAPAPRTQATPTTSACATSHLDVWLDTQGSGATGHTYYFLNFTNMSGSTCTLFGYPGVSGVTISGSQIGSAAAHNGATPHTVTLANGATTHTLVGVVNPGFIPPAQCHPVTAAGLRVYPPNQTTSKVVPYPFPACSASGAGYLSVAPVGFP